MNNKLTVVLLLLTLLLGTGIYFVLRTPQDYSEKISYDVASTLITHFSNDQYDEAFENWDIVHIDDELYLISYSQTPVNDVYTSKHSWIVYKDQNVYEVKDGQLLKGEHLDVEIAKKFNHNIQTFQKSVIIETIDFEQEIRKSNRIIKDKKSVFQKGINGELEKTQSTTLINGEVVDSATVERVRKDPQLEIILLGTYVAPPPPPPPATKQPDIKEESDVNNGRVLKWYNTRYNKDGSLSSWGDKMYGEFTFRATGCVPTALAIALSGYNVNVTPEQVGDYLFLNGLYNSPQYIGTGGKGVVNGARNYGIHITGLSTKEAITNALKKGNVVLAAIQSGKFGVSGSTHMVVLNGYENGSTYVIDPTFSNKSSNATINDLWSSQSYDEIDRELGYVFYELIGEGYIIPPEQESSDNDENTQEIILKEMNGMTREEANAYLDSIGLKAVYTEHNVEVDDLSLDRTTMIISSTGGLKHDPSNIEIHLDLNIYTYKDADAQSTEEENDH